MLHTNTHTAGLNAKHFQWSNTYTVGQTGVREGVRNAYGRVCVLLRQRWCLGRHVRGRGLLLWHLHCHLISGQDVLERGRERRKIKLEHGKVYSGVYEQLQTDECLSNKLLKEKVLKQ